MPVIAVRRGYLCGCLWPCFYNVIIGSFGAVKSGMVLPFTAGSVLVFLGLFLV